MTVLQTAPEHGLTCNIVAAHIRFGTHLAWLVIRRQAALAGLLRTMGRHNCHTDSNGRRFHRPLPFALLGTHDPVTTKSGGGIFPPPLFCLRGLRRRFPFIAGAFLIPGAARGAQQCGEDCYRCGVFDPLG